MADEDDDEDENEMGILGVLGYRYMYGLGYRLGCLGVLVN